MCVAAASMRCDNHGFICWCDQATEEFSSQVISGALAASHSPTQRCICDQASDPKERNGRGRRGLAEYWPPNVGNNGGKRGRRASMLAVSRNYYLTYVLRHGSHFLSHREKNRPFEIPAPWYAHLHRADGAMPLFQPSEPCSGDLATPRIERIPK